MPLHWWDDGRGRGERNMVRDRALWRQAESGERLDPALVLYGWNPPAVSLGYHQDSRSLDAAAVKAAGVDVVRRPTGGAAVLHHREVTYAVVGRLDAGFGRAVQEIYDVVARALVAALADIGVRADRAGEGRPAQLACFASAGGHEITVDGRKLVGSALRRGRWAFLQHGSILCGPEHAQLAELVSASPADRARMGEELRRSTTDLGALGVRDLTSVGPALARALARGLGTEAIRVQPSVESSEA